MLKPNGRGSDLMKTHFIGGGSTEITVDSGAEESGRGVSMSLGVGTTIWDRFGVGGEVGDEESAEEEVPEGVEPERIKLQEDGEVVKKIGDPKLPTEQEVKEHYEMGHA
eukprot:11837594-Karenia_brevis.AAC.1